MLYSDPQCGGRTGVFLVTWRNKEVVNEGGTILFPGLGLLNESVHSSAKYVSESNDLCSPFLASALHSVCHNVVSNAVVIWTIKSSIMNNI